MKNLVKHIELLLLDNECVIIPQFGGFVTQFKEVEYLDEESLFIPPCRTVGFNEKLQGNDGLLVASYMKAYQITESEAKRMIHSEVLEMRQQLLENGSCDLGALGLFNQNEDGEIIFSPCAAGLSTPEFYGLDVLEFPRLQLDVPRTDVGHSNYPDYKPLLSKDESGFTINISHKAVHQLATVAAAVLFFFFFATPISNVDIRHSEDVVGKSVMLASSFLIPQMSVEDFCPKVRVAHQEGVLDSACIAGADSVDVSPVADVSDGDVPVQSSVSSITQTDVPSASEELMTDEYAVVVASSIPETNALNLIEKLEQQGLSGASLYKTGKMIRVVFRGYKTQQEAQFEKNRLYSKGADFKEVWVLKLNE